MAAINRGNETPKSQSKVVNSLPSILVAYLSILGPMEGCCPIALVQVLNLVDILIQEGLHTAGGERASRKQ